MNVQQRIPITRSIKGKLFFLICGLVVIILAGNWYLFRFAKQLLEQEVQTRGNWIVQHVACTVFPRELQTAEECLQALLREEEVEYVTLLDPSGTLVFSESTTRQNPATLPMVSHDMACEADTPLTTEVTFAGQRLYDVGFRLSFGPTGTASSSEEGNDESENANSNCHGSVHIGLSLHDVEQKLQHLRFITVVITGAVLLFVMSGVGIFSRTLIAPLVRLADIAIKMASGDLRQQVQVVSQDEIGRLEYGLSHTIQTFHQITLQLQTSCEHLTRTADEILSLSASQTEVTQKHATEIFHLSHTLEQLAQGTQRITDNAAEVVEKAELTVKSTAGARNTVNDTMKSMKDIRIQVSSSTERVASLGEKISQVGNVIKIINTIADQTKLLAFNASIEAAGAGESGGRFSVVATEVRRLANTVVESVEQIKESVSSIQAATSDLILSSETGLRRVDHGEELIVAIRKTLEQSMTMLDETTRSAQEISRSMQQQQAGNAALVAGMNEISRDSEYSLELNKRTNAIASNLHEIADKFARILDQVKT